MEVDQTRESRRSFIPDLLIRFKRCVRTRKLLKYTLLMLGFVLAIGIIATFYIMGAAPSKEHQDGDSAPIEQNDEEKSTCMCEETGSADFQPAFGRARLVASAETDTSMILTEIGESTPRESFNAIYKEKIFSKKDCSDNLCGKCRQCGFFNDAELFSKLAASAKTYGAPALLCDTTSSLTKMLDDVSALYSNYSKRFVQVLAEEIANNRVLQVTLQVYATKNQGMEKAPFMCSIVVEGLQSCFAHRFRLQNLTKASEASLMEMFELAFKYKGYSLRASLKSVCRAICVLKPGERTEVVLEAVLLDARKKAADSKGELARALESPSAQVEYAIRYTSSGKETVQETVKRYKCAHLFSLLGSNGPETDKIMIAFSPDPIRKVEGFFDWAIDGFRNLIRMPEKEKPKPDQGKYYGTEEAYAISMLSSFAAWRYGQEPVHIKVLAVPGEIRSVAVCGSVLPILCETQDAVELAELFDQVSILAGNACSEFVKIARDALEMLSYAKEGSQAEIEILQSGQNIAASVHMEGPEKISAWKKCYKFVLPLGLCSALKGDTKEPWLCTFMQALAFVTCAEKPEDSKGCDEVVQVRQFLGSEKECVASNKAPAEKDQDVLDFVYSYLGDKESSEMKYVALLVGKTLFLKFTTESTEDAKQVLHSTLYEYTSAGLTGAIRKALGSNVSFGILKQRDFVAWAGVKVAYDEYKPSMTRVSLNVVDYAYYRLYFLARPILNSIKRGNLAELSLADEIPNSEENFCQWLSGLGRFSKFLFSHPLVPIILEAPVGHSLALSIEMLDKKAKKKQEETTCKIRIRCGAFEETVELHYSELNLCTSSDADKDKPVNLLFARILNLPTVKEDPSAYLSVKIESLLHYPSVYITIEEHGDANDRLHMEKEKITVNIDTMKKNAKILATDSADAFKMNTPRIINGNIGVIVEIL
ncbi:uncharacterized protein NEMAJ01_1379 [Nematocida major]|uniref:uncharacterized protein n=1 Tax=Nematocida major TaxID=1912982 RepID=UPI002007C743|nr:uncharacterized protein NEMAJ01_1379 [Nematocida major]KAH9386483.1 hypothetical protein NEMAJ01_1379 [Nematocida major]